MHVENPSHDRLFSYYLEWYCNFSLYINSAAPMEREGHRVNYGEKWDLEALGNSQLIIT